MANDFNLDFLTRQADRNNLGAVLVQQGSIMAQIAQAYVRVESLDEIAAEVGELQYRVRAPGGNTRMIMSAISLQDEFGVNANLAGFDDTGTVTFYVNADDGKLYALQAVIAGWSITTSTIEKLSSNIGIKIDSTVPAIYVGNLAGTHMILDGANQRFRSSNFVTGSAGFNIAGSTGDAEFNNITARGELKTFLLTSQNQMAVGGNIIVSKDAGKLGADVSSGATTVDFGKAMTSNDWIKIQGPDSAGSNALEWMKVGTLISGTTYNVTRNVDGSGANNWLKDTPFVVIGQNGDHRIELSAGTPSTIQLVTQGATWNAQTVQASMSTQAGAITAGGGDVLLNSSGIIIANSVTAMLNFRDNAGASGKIVIGADPNNDLEIVNLATSPKGTITLYLKNTAGSTVQAWQVREDPANANVIQAYVPSISNGAKISIGGEVVIWGQKDGQETVFNSGGYDISFKVYDANSTLAFHVEQGQTSIGSALQVNSGINLASGYTYNINGSPHNHFNDAEGDPANLAVNAADGTSSYAARRDHAHKGMWIAVTKGSDEAVQSDTTLSQDGDLTFVMEANQKYRIRGKIWFTTPAAADFKYRFRSGGSPTVFWIKHKYTAPLATAETEQAIENGTPGTTISVLSAGANTDPGYIEFEARVEKENAQNSFFFDWAQNTSTASNTTVKAGSYVEYQKV